VSGRHIFSVKRGTLDVLAGNIWGGFTYDVPVHVESGCTLEGWNVFDPNDLPDPNDPNTWNTPGGNWASSTNNIDGDPNFVTGPLGQLLPQSGCRRPHATD